MAKRTQKPGDPKISVKVRVGNSHKGFSSVHNPWTEQLTKHIRDTVTDRAYALVMRDVKRLEKKIEDAANKTLAQVAKFIALNIIGRQSANIYNLKSTGANAQTHILSAGSDTLRWLALSHTTRNKKRKNKHKHYLHEGDLKSAVAAAGPAILRETGGVVVKLVPRKQSMREHIGPKNFKRIADIQINLAPKVGGSTLPGLQTGRWADSRKDLRLERRLFGDASIIEKLEGPKNPKDGHMFRHRPLMQPMITYWLLFKVPAEIDRVIDAARYRPKVQSGVGDLYR